VFHGAPPRSASWLLKDTTAAALGLCALLSECAFAFSAVRWLRAAYLV
jgi:threonine/homoserine/homoserine lactone efflux protein